MIRLKTKETVKESKDFEDCKAVILPSLNGPGEDILIKEDVFDELFDRPASVAKHMKQTGIIVAEPENRSKRQDRIPGVPGKQNVYRLSLDKLQTTPSF